MAKDGKSAKAKSGKTARQKKAESALEAARDLPLGSNEERAALAELERKIEREVGRGRKAAYKAGLLFDRIATGALQRAAGVSSLEAYAQARFPSVGYRTLDRWRRVAREFAEETVVKHGTRKLDLGLAYIAATPAQERPADILRLEIAIDESTRVPFAKATSRQMEQAVAYVTRAPVEDKTAPRGLGPIVERVKDAIESGRWPDELEHPRVSARSTAAPDGARVGVLVIELVPEAMERVGQALVRAAQG